MATELHASLLALSRIEAEEAAKKNATQAAAAEKEEKSEGKGKPQSDDSSLTPEQLAKVEAKRKAKAEKAASKAAAKEQRKGGVALGAGSTQLRAIALELIGADGEGSSVEDKLHALISLMTPLNADEKSLINQFATVLEQLNVGGKRKPKIAKGARDFTPEQMRIREQAFNAIRRVFKRHGGVEIDTPVFELKEVLTGKYGEDSKLIYDLADQGGELLSLRYDLTVPFARFLAMNSVGNIKRYHIAKVYRRDNPQLARGRYREFYQCDFDIAGSYSPMVPDAEVITVATEILSDLPVGKFLVKLNHRKILDAVFEICGVPAEKFRPICSAVDKLDKMSWEDVKAEMVNEKGLPSEVADRISTFVLKSGQPMELWNEMMEAKLFGDHEAANNAMNELKILFGYLEAMGSLPHVSFDLSLARGLDYYTGVIYEVVLTDGTSQVGSIAAGGRYDNLVGMFSPAGVQTPCVGVSIGIERVFTIMEKKAEQLKLLQQSHIQVYIASIGANLMHERMKIAQLLWNADISAEYSHLDNPKFKRQLDDSLERGIPFMVVFGQDEINKGMVKVKNMKSHVELEIPRDRLIDTLVEQGCSCVSGGSDRSFIAAMKQSELVVDA
jgi:histidyl-tRNA synthetase